MFAPLFIHFERPSIGYCRDRLVELSSVNNERPLVTGPRWIPHFQVVSLHRSMMMSVLGYYRIHNRRRPTSGDVL